MAGLPTAARPRDQALCPTLVTGSRHDGEVSFEQAADFVRALPNARLGQRNPKSYVHQLGADRREIPDDLP